MSIFTWINKNRSSINRQIKHQMLQLVPGIEAAYFGYFGGEPLRKIQPTRTCDGFMILNQLSHHWPFHKIWPVPQKYLVVAGRMGFSKLVWVGIWGKNMYHTNVNRYESELGTAPTHSQPTLYHYIYYIPYNSPFTGTLVYITPTTVVYDTYNIL